MISNQSCAHSESSGSCSNGLRRSSRSSFASTALIRRVSLPEACPAKRQGPRRPSDDERYRAQHPQGAPDDGRRRPSSPGRRRTRKAHRFGVALLHLRHPAPLDERRVILCGVCPVNEVRKDSGDKSARVTFSDDVRDLRENLSQRTRPAFVSVSIGNKLDRIIRPNQIDTTQS